MHFLIVATLQAVIKTEILIVFRQKQDYPILSGKKKKKKVGRPQHVIKLTFDP